MSNIKDKAQFELERHVLTMKELALKHFENNKDNYNKGILKYASAGDCEFGVREVELYVKVPAVSLTDHFWTEYRKLRDNYIDSLGFKKVEDKWRIV